MAEVVGSVATMAEEVDAIVDLSCNSAGAELSPTMPISPTGHEVDLAEADKQLNQRDAEVDETVEDMLNEESDDEDAVPSLVDNPPSGFSWNGRAMCLI